MKTVLNSTIKKLAAKSNARAALAVREIDHLLQKSVRSQNTSFLEAFAYSGQIAKLVANRTEFVVGALACAVVVVSSDIFMPLASIDPVQRLLIVASATVFGGAIAFILHYFTQTLHIKYGVNLWAITAVTSVGCSLVFSTVIPLTVRHIFDYPPPKFWDLFIPMAVLYGLSNSFVLWRINPYICRDQNKEQSISQDIIAILPAQKRGALLAISAADHYVEITTDSGTHLLRMTMKSAVAKTNEADGLRVHRSHWVAFGAMLSHTKEGERNFVTLRNGARIPVSPKMAQEVRSFLDGNEALAAQ